MHHYKGRFRGTGEILGTTAAPRPQPRNEKEPLNPGRGATGSNAANRLPSYFMLRKALCSAGLLVLLAGCEQKQNIKEFALRDATMPNGAIVRVEGLRDPMDMARGAQFRESLPPDRGLLYEYAKVGNYRFWMYHTKISIDTIWLDRSRTVVEIAPNMPPCPSASAQKCPLYGGHEQAMFVLQLAGGMAEKYNIRVGSVLSF